MHIHPLEKVRTLCLLFFRQQALSSRTINHWRVHKKLKKKLFLV